MKLTTMNTAQTVARELAEAFTTGTRTETGETFYKFKSDAPAWIKARDSQGRSLSLRFHQAVDDRLPDDWIYERAYWLAQALCERESIEAMRDAAHEIVDGDVDIYNADLSAWLASHLGNQSLCDEAVEEMGAGSAGGIVGAMQAGQYKAIDAICQCLINEIEEEAESRDDESEAA